MTASASRDGLPGAATARPDDLSPVLERWSDWCPLRGIGRDPRIPSEPGLYRIRAVGSAGIDYIGQTGGSLRGRLGMLNGIYREEMPYRDPHTAGPALWALLQLTRCEFEASVTVVPGATPWRKAVEAAAITLYRAEAAASPTANFGRMPPGAVASSGNNARLVKAGKRFRGRLDPGASPPAPSLPVLGHLTDDPLTPDWFGLPWSTWEPVQEAASARRRASGVYRIRQPHVPGVLAYVGQGLIASRLVAHARKAGVQDARQSLHFSGRIEASIARLEHMPRTQLLELENDLIAAHVLGTGKPPSAQFLG